MTTEREYPVKDCTKWELVIKATLSASGCDEIVMTAQTKKAIYQFLGRFLRRHDIYEIRERNNEA